MQIKNNNNITFGTNIIFLSARGMRRVVEKMQKSNEYTLIDEWYIRPPQGNKTQLGYRKNCSLAYTYGVRNCTAGVSVKKRENARYFWHIQPTRNNIKNIYDLRSITNCDNVILLGAKSIDRESVKLFEKFERFINKDNVPATIMKNLSLNWEAYLAYYAKNDTLYICIQEIYGNILKRVGSMKELKKVFEKVIISPTDKIKFPNQIQEYILTRNFKI